MPCDGSSAASSARVTRFTGIRRILLNAALRRLSTNRLRVLAWRALAAAGARELTFERDRVRWTVPAGEDLIGFSIFQCGGFQQEEIGAVLGWMRAAGLPSAARDVFVDVGANIGSTCIPVARACGCRVLAIEPVARNVRLLRTNLEANGLAARIHVAQCAVLRAPGRVTMALMDDQSGGHFVRRGGVGAAPGIAIDGYEEVAGNGLAAIAHAAGIDAGQIALVWSDVQGCEAEVVESGAPLWARGVPLWAEVEPVSLERQGALAGFADLMARHFDRFVTAQELMRRGPAARPAPIAEFGAVVRGITPQQGNIDALFLPPGCPEAPRAAAGGAAGRT